jgi:hypothetical protein
MIDDSNESAYRSYMLLTHLVLRVMGHRIGPFAKLRDGTSTPGEGLVVTDEAKCSACGRYFRATMTNRTYFQIRISHVHNNVMYSPRSFYFVASFEPTSRELLDAPVSHVRRFLAAESNYKESICTRFKVMA